jgi:O-acetyl-ADP-ribose deacetylase (regulator of RNase III)
MDLRYVDGDLLDQDVDVIVNAWNRNVIPWWLLLPSGVSGAIKRRGGKEPFRELARMGAIPLGGAVETGPGRLPFKAIIHVAGISLLWRSSEQSVRQCVRNAMAIVKRNSYASVAFPLIGAGTGGSGAERVKQWISDELAGLDFAGRVIVVSYSGQ